MAAPAADAYWARPAPELLSALGTGEAGLDPAEAAARLARDRRPRSEHSRRPWWRILLGQFASPIILILVGATIVAMVLGDTLDGAIIIAIILASGLLGFWQEYRADTAVASLLERVQVTVTVRRGGADAEVPVADIVPGDIVRISAGGIVPADCRLLASASLLVDESALTGESFPVEKDADAACPADAPLAARTTCLHFGSHVASGSGTAVVVRVGADTELGRVTHALRAPSVATAFERGITSFGLLLLRVMIVLTALIFVVNWIAGRPVIDSLLFALALAVGLTPQMLPAIVSLSLSSGARRLAEKQVIVKRLDAIEDLGSLTVLCTDKTGTLTVGSAQLDKALDPSGADSDRVLALASLNAGLQRAFANPLDAAILARHPLPADAESLGELPYDFQRKRLSVLAAVDGADTLIAKGALDGVLDVCATIAGRPIATARPAVDALFRQLSDDGYRVIGVATKRRDRGAPLALGDETGMDLAGLLAFLDPAKPGAGEAIAELAELGVQLRLITGDNARAAAAIARSVGIDASEVMLGAEVAALDDVRLAVRLRGVRVFAEVEPVQKSRIVQALRHAGESVGFLGDGINDAPALHAADVGISVESAVDVAKQAASIVLLEKGLGVVADGVRLGRATFANTLKYVRLTTSANFGNMLSMAVASIALPFLPLLPRQILLLNFLSDIPAMAIAADEVDPERVRRPVSWAIKEIQSFMLVFGALSTVFDLLSFGLLIWVAQATEPIFQSSWFVVSTLTELGVMFSLRTARPIWASRPARALVLLSVLMAVLTAALPFIPWIAEPLALVPIPWGIGGLLLLLVVGYVAANELVKRRFLRGERAHPFVNSRDSSELST